LVHCGKDSSKLIGSPFMRPGAQRPEVEAASPHTVAGQADFVDMSSRRVCGDCVHFLNTKQSKAKGRCVEYMRRMQGKAGAQFASSQRACRQFRARNP
jgi:hypothetical protein